MLRPSYKELMDITNKEVKEGEEKIVNSRYSIVIATSKRARQIASSRSASYELKNGDKALSLAVEEIKNGDVKILSSDTSKNK